MGALGESIKASIPEKGPRCTVALTLDALEGEDRADLLQALASPVIPGTAISAALKQHDHQVGADSVQRHRRGACGCPR